MASAASGKPARRARSGAPAGAATLASTDRADRIRSLRAGRRVALAGSPVAIRVDGDRVSIRLWLIARPGADLGATTQAVRTAVAAAIERLLGLAVETVTVVVDGIGG